MTRVCFLLFLIASIPAHAAIQNYPLVDQGHRVLSLAVEGNRISVEHDRIAQLFYPEGALDIQTDEVQGQIFIRFLRHDPVTLTLITESGLTQDLTLKPLKKTFQSVQLTTPHPKQAGSEPPSKTPVQRIMKIVQEVRWRKKVDRHTARAYPGLEVVEEASLKREGLIGLRYRIRNGGEVTLRLDESSLQRPGDRALSLGTSHLAPGASTILIVVREGR